MFTAFLFLPGSLGWWPGGRYSQPWRGFPILWATPTALACEVSAKTSTQKYFPFIQHIDSKHQRHDLAQLWKKTKTICWFGKPFNWQKVEVTQKNVWQTNDHTGSRITELYFLSIIFTGYNIDILYWERIPIMGYTPPTIKRAHTHTFPTNNS